MNDVPVSAHRPKARRTRLGRSGDQPRKRRFTSAWVKLAKNGLAEPPVDEIAPAPLDLWAQEHGYSKLELNLMGM